MRFRSRMGRGNFEGEGGTYCKVLGHCAVSCAKTAEPIEMPFGMLSLVDPRSHVDSSLGPPWKGAFLRGNCMPNMPFV